MHEQLSAFLIISAKVDLDHSWFVKFSAMHLTAVVIAGLLLFTDICRTSVQARERRETEIDHEWDVERDVSAPGEEMAEAGQRQVGDTRDKRLMDDERVAEELDLNE